MTNPHFSFIILTFNEEVHLPRLLDSIRGLRASTFVLDSGSTDQTLRICSEYGVKALHHKFVNHPKQWDTALDLFKIQTPWVICLDADQVISPELRKMLLNFNNEDYQNVNGIYFNRKYYFRGRWIRFGGYFPKYLLKMFRYGVGYSDLQENMDHKFQVPCNTLIWSTGYLIEENLKENKIAFWLEKHNRYSDLLAEEEVQRLLNLRYQRTIPMFWGSPNERNAWFKKIWWTLPRYVRPFLYFSYRIIFRLGFLDGRTGAIFHFLQAFWFRLIVDIKIEETLNHPRSKTSAFVFLFMMYFTLIYGFFNLFIGITNPGNYYIAFIDTNFNFINLWRSFSIFSASYILEALKYNVSTEKYHLINHGFSGFRLVYSCLGYGVMSCFSAFVLAFPKPRQSKLSFLISGLFIIQVLNILRLTLISIYYKPASPGFNIDHHELFNFLVYLILGTMVYSWIKSPAKNSLNNAKSN